MHDQKKHRKSFLHDENVKQSDFQYLKLPKISTSGNMLDELCGETDDMTPSTLTSSMGQRNRSSN